MTLPGGNLDKAFGRYRLLERLGQGGMAEVFKAKSYGVEGFEKVLVIKRILPKLAEHPKFVDMFVHEAKLAVRLSHANIVQVFDLGKVDQPDEPTSYFIAMEYVPGLDLATVLSRARRSKIAIPLGMAVYVAAEVAKALDHAHRRRDEQARPLGIVHRDISPQNVLVSWEGEVKVTDFGIAKARDSISSDEASDSRVGRIRGKLGYMSPEQTRAETLDGRSDLFSLGTVLYEMIAGSNPFVAPTSFETLRRVSASEYPPLELLRPEAPAALVGIVSRMLAKSANDRFADAGKLHEQLLGYFYGSGERFGAGQLAEFLEAFHDQHSLQEIASAVVFEDEQNAANDRTPVEVPATTGVSRTSGSGPMRAVTGEKSESGSQPKTAEIAERREVTCLVLAFDDRSASADAATTVRRTCDVLERYGASVLEREPEHVAALFGLGDADGRDTDSAVRAALAALRAHPSNTGSAGVHVARIVVDAQGTPVRDERLASLVAVAQSLARAAEGRVVLSAVSERVVRSAFATEPLKAQAGRPLPEGATAVTSVQVAASGRFVGRQTELKRLGEILAEAAKRHLQLVTVTGDKGIGKTRLLAEMHRRIAKGNYNVGFYSASCPKNGTDTPLSGLTAMLHVLCGIQEGDDDTRIQAVLPRLRALGLQADECDVVLAQLGGRSERGARPSPQEVGLALRTAFGHMVQSLCEDRVQVFAWDDAQGLDAATLDVVLGVAERSRTRPDGMRALLIFASREAPPAALAAHQAHHVLSVGELSGSDAERLVADRAGSKVLPAELLAFCRDRAGGHPLFVEELIKELADSGALVVSGGAARAKLDGAHSIPRTLRTLIAGRVSRLEPTDRAVMQAAAILGEPILLPVLAVLTKLGDANVERVVRALAARDLVRTTAPTQASFATPMHGEIVLDAIPPEARRELHAAAAAAYVTIYGDDGGELAERVGQHLYEAGDRDRAATCYARAAEQRSARGQLEPAIRWMTRALDLVDVDRRTAAELGGWLAILSDGVSHVRTAMDLASTSRRALLRIDAVGSLDERVVARVHVARALGAVDLFDEAHARLADAFALAGERDDLRGRALTVETELASRSGDYVRAVMAASKLEALGDIVDPRILLWVAHARGTEGDQASALRALEQAARLAPPDDLASAAEREKVRVLVFVHTRDFKAAVAASSLAVDLTRTLGYRFQIAAVLHNLGEASRRTGDLPRAYASYTESKEIAENAGHMRLATLNRAHLAYLDGLNGGAGAAALLREAVAYNESRGYHSDALECRSLLGALLKRRGEATEAKRELEEVLRLAAAYGDRLIAEDAREDLVGM